MVPLQWGPTYELGIPLLDAQHRHLISLVNEAMAAVGRREERILEAILDQLMEYAKYHFAAEEERMAAASFPERESHMQEHEAFQERVTDLYSRFLEGDPDVAVEMTAFLRAWLVAHIQGSDRKYIPYLLRLEESRG